MNSSIYCSTCSLWRFFMSCAIVHFKPCFTKWNQIFFTKKLKEKIKSEIIISNKKIPVYLIPVVKEKPSEKMIAWFISYLKEEKIDTILLSDDSEALPFINKIKNCFQIFDGTKVINYKLYDILRKCAEVKQVELSKSTLIVYVNEPEFAKNYILKTYKFVKKIKIQTDKPSLFSELSAFFLYEYGLFIDIVKEVKKENNEIIIVLNDTLYESDFYLGKEKNTEVIFSVKNLLSKINFYKKINQNAIEFLIYLLYGNMKDENIKKFFKSYSVRVIKLIK